MLKLRPYNGKSINSIKFKVFALNLGNLFYIFKRQAYLTTTMLCYAICEIGKWINRTKMYLSLDESLSRLFLVLM